MPAGAVLKEEEIPSWPAGAFVKQEVVASGEVDLAHTTRWVLLSTTAQRGAPEVGNSSEAYQTLLRDARGAVETGAGDALHWVRAALVHTAAVAITPRDGTEVSVQPTHSGFYLNWPHAMNPMDVPKANKKAPKSGRGAHFRTEKVRHVKLTMTQELADDVSKGFFSALLARGARSAARSEAALSLTALALQPVFAQFLRELLSAPSPPVALHTEDVSTITEVLRSAMHTGFAEFAGLLPIHARWSCNWCVLVFIVYTAHSLQSACRCGRMPLDADPWRHCSHRRCQEEHTSTPC